MFESDMRTLQSLDPLVQDRHRHFHQKHTVAVQKITTAVNKHIRTNTLQAIPNDDTTKDLVKEGGLLALGTYFGVSIVADDKGNIFVAADEESADSAAKGIDKGRLRFYRGMGQVAVVEDPVAA